MRRKPFFALAVAIALLTVVVAAGCGQQAATKQEPVKLTVWSHMTDPEIAVIKQAADQWAQQTGNQVDVVAAQGGFQDFATAAQSDQGPDIMFGLPHDNLGTFQAAGLLAPVPQGFLNPDDYVPLGLQAVTFNGQLYAVPLSMESYALVMNTNLVKNAPATWTDLINTAKSLTKKDQYGFMYDVNNFYYSYAFVAGEGGYVFKNTGSGLDPNDIGLNNAGAVKGFTFIADLVRKDKLMPADVNGDIINGQFTAGKLAMTITGPWSIQGYKDANIPIQVVPLPAIKLPDGNAPKPFVGVYAAFVSAASKHQDLAWQLMKYLIQNTPQQLFQVGHRIPVLKSALADPAIQGDPITQAFAQSAAGGEPMPNIPQMPAVWTPAGNALTLITSGKATPQAAADQLVQNIKEQIASQK